MATSDVLNKRELLDMIAKGGGGGGGSVFGGTYLD